MLFWLSHKLRYRCAVAGSVILCSLLCMLSACQLQEQSVEEFYTVAEFPASPAFAEQKNIRVPINYQNMKGVWISYLEYNRHLKGKNQSDYEKQVEILLDDLVARGLNTVVVQVRSHGDAYYASSLYPWSKYVTGIADKDPGYDPFAIFLEKAHARSLSVHAWINPYRLSEDTQMQSLSERYLIRQWYGQKEYMAQKDGCWYLNPGNEQVQQLILQGVTELAEGYPIDGIQIDDYFYTIPPETFGQSEKEAQGYTTQLVQGIYQCIKMVNEQLLFGVSPGGNYLAVPKSDTTQYTDLITWCGTEGYLDYVVPQIYWAFDDATTPFEEILAKWEKLLKPGHVTLYIGLAAYKFADSNILQQQVACVETSDVAEGYCYFRYDNLVSESG